MLHNPCKLTAAHHGLQRCTHQLAAVLQLLELCQHSEPGGHHASGALSAQLSAVVYNFCKLAAVHDCLQRCAHQLAVVLQLLELCQHSKPGGHHASGALSAQLSAMLHNSCKLAAVNHSLQRCAHELAVMLQLL